MDRRALGPVLTAEQLSRLRSILRAYKRTGSLLNFATVTVKDLLLEDVSYPASDLRLAGNGKPICNACYDNVWHDDGVLVVETYDEDGSPDEIRRWCDLERFAPEHEQRIAELERQLAEARKSSAPQTADINMARAGMMEWDKQHALGERHWPTMLIAVYNAMALAGDDAATATSAEDADQ